jgi:hypothetical protein
LISFAVAAVLPSLWGLLQRLMPAAYKLVIGTASQIFSLYLKNKNHLESTP